jgi:hypothetical protein
MELYWGLMTMGSDVFFLMGVWRGWDQHLRFVLLDSPNLPPGGTRGVRSNRQLIAIFCLTWKKVLLELALFIFDVANSKLNICGSWWPGKTWCSHSWPGWNWIDMIGHIGHDVASSWTWKYGKWMGKQKKCTSKSFWILRSTYVARHKMQKVKHMGTLALFVAKCRSHCSTFVIFSGWTDPVNKSNLFSSFFIVIWSTTLLLFDIKTLVCQDNKGTFGHVLYEWYWIVLYLCSPCLRIGFVTFPKRSMLSDPMT